MEAAETTEYEDNGSIDVSETDGNKCSDATDVNIGDHEGSYTIDENIGGERGKRCQ